MDQFPNPLDVWVIRTLIVVCPLFIICGLWAGVMMLAYGVEELRRLGRVKLEPKQPEQSER